MSYNSYTTPSSNTLRNNTIRNNTIVKLLQKLLNANANPVGTVLGCPKAAFDCENYVEYVLSGDSKLIHDSNLIKRFSKLNTIKSPLKPYRVEILTFGSLHFSVLFPNGEMYSQEGGACYGAMPLMRYDNMRSNNIHNFTHGLYGKITKREPHYVDKAELDAMLSRANCDGIGRTHPYGQCPGCDRHLTIEQLKNHMHKHLSIPLKDLNLLDSERGCRIIANKYSLQMERESHLPYKRVPKHAALATNNLASILKPKERTQESMQSR